MLDLFKYGRTPHLPWSSSVTEDDIIQENLEFLNGEIVITEKLDGENTTMYHDYIHARSLDSKHHASRDWVKALHGQIKQCIPKGYRLVGENVYAKHSIKYTDLDSYFYIFNVWDDLNNCLSWEEVEDFAFILDLRTVPVIFQGQLNVKSIHSLWDNKFDEDYHEGYVVRNAGAFHYNDFQKNIAKYVRNKHVQTTEHWMHSQIEPNLLK